MSVHHFAMPSGSLLAGNPRWLLLALVSLAGNSLYSKESLTGVRTRATTISGSPNQTTERRANGCGTTVEAEAVATPTGLRTRRRSWIWGVTSPAAPRGIGSLAGKLAVCPCVGCEEKKSENKKNKNTNKKERKKNMIDETKDERRGKKRRQRRGKGRKNALSLCLKRRDNGTH